MSHTRRFLIAVLLVVKASPAMAQDVRMSAADSALNVCDADKADRLYSEILASGQRQADALTGKARVISQCRIEPAPMMRKAALVGESIELLQRALAIDSMHVGARYILALNYYHMPAFLNQTDNAIREMEKFIALHGRKQIPLIADVRAKLSELYGRKGATAPTQPAAVYDVDAIVVEAGRFSVDDARGSASLKRMDIVTMPGGTADVLQVFQAMPGVTRATEGSDLYVRGGDPAEAPVFVDGARMTYAGAFETLSGGIFGVLDPNGIKKADFSSGGFSARYGNALSGILDITSEGRPEDKSFRAGMNLVGGGVTYRTPLGKSAGLWATTKATQTTALLWTQGRTGEYPSDPWSLNGMGGLVFNPKKNVEVKATGLTEVDDAVRTVDVLQYRGSFHGRGGTSMGLLSARALNDAGNRSVRGTLSAARRTTLFQLGVLDRERHDDMLTARVDGDVTTESGMRIRTGVEAAAMSANEEGSIPVSELLAPGSPSRVVNIDRDASHVGGYVESEMSRGNFGFIAGVRSDKLPSADGATVDPRIALAYRTNGWTLRTGAGLFHQGTWRTGYRTPSIGSPAGVATSAKHFVVGLERELPVFLRIEAFAKSYSDYAKATGTGAEEFIQQGPMIEAGKAIGVDALVRWKASSAVSGWASYSYLNGKVKVADKWTPSAVDVRHTMTGVGKFAFGNNWEVGSTLRLATGKPFTPRGGVIHSERLPTYARFDTRLTRLIPAKNGTFVTYIEGLNLLDRHNVMSYTYDANNRRIPIESFFAHRTLVIGAEAML